MSRFVPRAAYLDFLTSVQDPGLVRIITGVRRSGKSALLALYRDHLRSTGVQDEEILVINFEDFANDSLRNPQAFHEFVLEHKAQGVHYLHVDEVQELPDWARVINSLRLPEDLEICVTGSNASMFAGESATYLAGRYIEVRVLPLSLREYVEFTHGADTEPSYADFEEWMRVGGFPATAITYAQAQDEHLAFEYNRALFDSIFTRDIALRGQIRDTATFLRVAQFIFDSSGSPVTTHRIVGQLKAEGYSASSETVDRYLQLMEDAHLLYRCRRLDTQGKQWLRGNGKFYFVDPGLRNALLGSRDINQGHDLENMVFLELLRRGYQVATGVAGNSEIDFVATRGEETTYIQVALSTSEVATLKRELDAFRGAPLGARCVLITLDRGRPNTGEVAWLDAIRFLSGSPLLS